MISLKKKYNLKNQLFTIGDVIKIYYIIFLKNKKHKKITRSFLGLCINRKKNYFDLINTVKGERMIMSFDIKSPVIFKLVLLKIYKKLIYRVSRIYFKKSNYYYDDFKNENNTIKSSMSSFKFSFFFSAYWKKKLFKYKKRKKKFRRKYSYIENWKSLKTDIKEINEIEKDYHNDNNLYL